MIQTNGMHGCSYLSADDLIVFAKKSLQVCDGATEVIKSATNILNERPSSKERMKALYEDLIEAVELEDLNEWMEICEDCGSIPETGACNYCKMD